MKKQHSFKNNIDQKQTIIRTTIFAAVLVLFIPFSSIFAQHHG